MKKLMVMAVAVVSAVVANAANVNWSIDMSGSPEGQDYSFWDGKTVYAINGDGASYIAMLTDGDVDGFNTAVGTLIAGGNATTGTFVDWSFGVTQGTNGNAADKLTLIALTGTNPDDTFYYDVASTAGMTYEAGQQAPGTLTPAFADYTAGTIGDVPEPTSGLLLLLGVAGLALKRRRA